MNIRKIAIIVVATFFSSNKSSMKVSIYHNNITLFKGICRDSGNIYAATLQPLQVALHRPSFQYNRRFSKFFFGKYKIQIKYFPNK
jgi:hypothetical protein